MPPLEAEVRAADLGSADAGASASADSDEATRPDTSREARIREAAYAAYERRGRTPGSEEQDWFEAERSIDAQEDGTGGTTRQP
ncbi:DUF2934 domain-containing protein [Variovorax sp. PBS-H4]|uniref:DUF2934 domain-containing protein n=1 Tax=Variovorax sp. PBS-H4 TaxID=434008 RepID=UPI0018D9F6CA|nr:DUF2934 domain-containing protein [Variovorax sp. PBS-H4]